MVAYTKPKQMKKEESERLRGGDQIKFIDLGVGKKGKNECAPIECVNV